MTAIADSGGFYRNGLDMRLDNTATKEPIDVYLNSLCDDPDPGATSGA